jgi:hypothetical protein
LKFSILIKKGLSFLTEIAIPTLALILLISASSFRLIPLMNYWRETALLDGMPVILGTLAQYFWIFHGLKILVLIAQVVFIVLIA